MFKILVLVLVLVSGVSYAQPTPYGPGSVSSPMGTDVQRPPGMPSHVDATTGVVSIPADIPAAPLTPVNTDKPGGFLLAITIIAGVLRMLVGLLKNPAVGSVWDKIPWLAQWATLGVATALLSTADAFINGDDWKTALAVGIGGLFTSWGAQKATTVNNKANVLLAVNNIPNSPKGGVA